MNRTGIVLAITLMLLMPFVFGSGAAPRINSFTEKSKDYDKKEGQLFTFTVLAEDDEFDQLAYEWNFGDGTGTFISTNPEISHVFYLTDPSNTKEAFTVEVSASDGTSASTKTLEVEVRRSTWKARLKEPTSSPDSPISKDGEVYIEIEVTNYKANAQNTASIIATAKIDGQEVDLEKEEKYFYGTFYPEEATASSALLEVTIESGSKDEEQEFPLFFESTELELIEVDIEKLGLGEDVGEVRAKIEHPATGRITKGNFSAVLYSGGEVKSTKELSKDGDFFSANFTHTISAEDYVGNASIIITGWDDKGNKLEENSNKISLEQGNPAFNIEIVQPDLKENSKLAYGQKIDIVANVQGSAEDIELKILFPEKDIDLPMVQRGSDYTYSLVMPSVGSTKTGLAVYGSGKIGGKKLTDIEFFEVELSTELIIEFVYPAEGEIDSVGDGKEIEVRITYPNGALIENKSIQGTLTLDNKPSTISLIKDNETGNFKASLKDELLGEQTIKLSVQGLPGLTELTGSKEISTNISRPLDLIGILLLLVVIALVGYAAYYIKSKLKTMPIETEAKPKPGSAKDEMKKLEVAFYKRKISEEEFKKRMLALQKRARTENQTKPGPKHEEIKIKKDGDGERLQTAIKKKLDGGITPLIVGRDIKIPKKLVRRPPATEKPKETISQQKKEEVKQKLGFLNAQSKQPGKLSMKEVEAVNKLVIALKPKAPAFTREEIHKSLISEGFSEPVAKEVVKRLFG